MSLRGRARSGAAALLVAATCAAHAWTVPTLALWETFLGTGDSGTLAARPEVRWVPQAWRANWAQQLTQLRQQNAQTREQRLTTLALRRRILKALQTAGCPIAFGTDSPQLYSVPGFSIHREIMSMSAAGLTPAQILAAGTRNPARYFGAEQEFGSVAAGQRADLILLNGNPLIDLRAHRRLPQPVTLAQIKADTTLSELPIVRQGRLSVSPVTAPQWSKLLKLAAAAD